MAVKHVYSPSLFPKSARVGVCVYSSRFACVSVGTHTESLLCGGPAVPAASQQHTLMTGTAKQWSLVHSSGGPTARSGHCVAVVKDEMFVFGGCGHPASSAKPPPPPAERGDAEEQEQEDEVGADMDPRCLGDLHVYNAARQRWSEVPFPTSKLRPAQRTCAAICASEEEDRLFLSGGAGDDPYDLRGDLLQYDVRERSWSVLYDDVVSTGAGSEVCPFRRIGHTMVHHSASGRLVLFGGSTGECQQQ